MTVESRDQRRGRLVRKPMRMPLLGWGDVLARVYRRLNEDYVALMAAGIAFFGLVAMIPGLAAVISLGGLFFDVVDLERQLDYAQLFLPDSGAELMRNQATAIMDRTEEGLGLAALFSLAVALVLASRGVNSLIDGINIAHAEPETRSFLARNLVAVALTGLLTLLALLALAVTILLPALLAAIGYPGDAEAVLAQLRWPLMAAVFCLSLGVVYRYAPARRAPQWRWVTPGAVVATLAWILGSVLFSLYVANFGRYNQTYGTLAGVIILMLWLWLSVFVVLLGAQLNAELEHQTRKDTTRGPDRPMGDRDAYMADTLGRARGS